MERVGWEGQNSIKVVVQPHKKKKKKAVKNNPVKISVALHREA
jgi:hypothetical protein